MQIHIPSNARLIIRSFIFKLTVSWMLGLLLGTLFALGLDPSFLSLMRRLLTLPMSIVIRLILAVLPFLICTYALMLRRQEIVLAVLFCKAFSFSVLAVSVLLIFSSAGWLVFPMLLFSDLLLVPMLCWFCLQDGRSLMRDHIISLGVAVIAVLIHYFAVLPFVAELID